MSDFERFHYDSVHDLLEELDELGLHLPVSDEFGSLAEPAPLGPVTAPNRLAVHPMEGCDCSPHGTPGELTRRRYLRFAAGGAGLIWMEACAVVPEGRANPRQMMLTEKNLSVFADLLKEMRRAAREAAGNGHEPVIFLQLTHSGRYSRPSGRAEPVLAHHTLPLDRAQGIPRDHPLISDQELDRLQEAYVASARLAVRAGFDGVDVKACHGYLVAGLLAARTRRDSRYGGPEYEDRTRFLRRVHRRIGAEAEGLVVTSRLGLWDPMPHPWGWGANKENPMQTDLAEPLRLVAELHEQGAPCISMTTGNPYYHPCYNRPFDTPTAEGNAPDEHPLTGVHRMLQIGRRVQRPHPDLLLVGTGYSYLRHFMPHFAAGALREGWAGMVGLGRGAIAYPDFARDVLQEGAVDPDRVCIACSRCSQLMRDGMPSGCVVRDGEVYGPLYRQGRRDA
ncbi:MAG: NADH:flavin oxidoreductase [Planctomycetota bacterium]